MRYLLSLFLFLFAANHLPAEPEGAKRNEVETEWPGISMQIAEIKRISGDRLLFLIRLQATAQAPHSTMIGMQRPIPPNVPKEDIEAGLYTPTAYSLLEGILKDEQGGRTYAAVTPDPKSPAYAPYQTLTSLSPGKFLVMAVQFPAPPLPPPSGDGKPVKQTVSLTLPKAKGAIENIEVPTPAKPAAQ